MEAPMLCSTPGGQQTKIVFVPRRCRTGQQSSSDYEYSDSDYSDSSSAASDARLRSRNALNSIWDADSKEAPPPGIWDGDGESDTARKRDHRCPVVDAAGARRPNAGSLSDAGTFKEKWRRLPDGPLESFLEPEAAVSRGCWRGARRAAAPRTDSPAEVVGRRRKRSSSTSRMIKISNIPPSVSMKHLTELFEKGTGKVVASVGERGCAWLTFDHSEEATKAVELFSEGTLDGNIIKVEMQP
mmetsp:Transcript_67912/g.140909  ORF Transcript_67912/g.140909 Transcript_67912/m.140909 type:complete len:242 (+) Transcript_67912:29-754(+)|eukprot:s4596_g6.t1